MPLTGRFATAFIVAKDNPAIRVEFQVFPDDLVIGRTAQYASYPTLGRSEPYRVYSYTDPRTYVLTLPFVESISQEDDSITGMYATSGGLPIFVGRTVAILEAFTMPRYATGLVEPPPLAYFIVGTYIMEQVIIRNVSISHPRDTFWGIDVPIIPGLPVGVGSALAPYYGLVSLQIEVVNDVAQGYENAGYYGFGALNSAIGSFGGLF